MIGFDHMDECVEIADSETKEATVEVAEMDDTFFWYLGSRMIYEEGEFF